MRLFHKGIVLRSAGDWVGEKKRGRIEMERLIEKADRLLNVRLGRPRDEDVWYQHLHEMAKPVR